MSASFDVSRGVKQGSILSPTLFLIVMDLLLKRLQSSQLGLSVNGFYAGGFIHADDIRMISTSIKSLEKQMDIVKSFASQLSLKLNVSKRGIVVFGKEKNL